jgi:hypothetical protein
MGVEADNSSGPGLQVVIVGLVKVRCVVLWSSEGGGHRSKCDHESGCRKGLHDCLKEWKFLVKQ